MSESDPIAFRPRAVADTAIRGKAAASSGNHAAPAQPTSYPSQICFNKAELNQILQVYGRHVASGEWRDYAIDMGREKAVFSIFRRSSEFPLYRVEKNPKMARKQGAFSVLTPSGLILKRGHDLGRVLAAIDKKIEVVS